MPRIIVGTSGYSYADWVGPVYPKGTRSGDFLELYSREFSFTELNFSYYALPRAEQLGRMLERTPSGFLIAVKAHQSMTHLRDGTAAESTMRFREALAPMVESNRLAAVLLQFPFSFHYQVDNRRYLDRLCRDLEELPVAVEFRNAGWQRQSVISAFEERGLTLVSVDEPDLPRLPKPTEDVTAPLAYVRLHGRNAGNWWEGDSTSRYDYLYSEGELASWVDRIRRIMRKARTLVVAFNNHFRGQAVQNARLLKTLLSRSQQDQPDVP
jgi:uncharacterized protein YecE (DUF72 family)